MADPLIEVAIAKRLGAFDLDVEFTAGSEGVTALFGQSGAGKSSLVHMFAGLLRPDRGRIVVNGRVLFDSAARIDLAPEKRRLGYVFQEDRLFPHLSVRANLLYGLNRTAPDERRITLEQVVDLLGIGHIMPRRPRNLSGGEKQRVAIGRALLASPRLLLMDEPLASLDVERRYEILPFIERLRDEFAIPIVYVTHMVEEIVRLADTLVVMSNGRVAAVGSVEEIMSRLDLRPLTGRYDAGAVVSTTVAGGDAAYGLSHLAFEGGTLRVPRVDLAEGTAVRVRVRARDVSLARSRPADTSVLNIFEGTVAEISAETEPGAQVDVKLDIGVSLWARITRRSLDDLQLRPGDNVFAMVKAVAIDRNSLGVPGPARPTDP